MKFIRLVLTACAESIYGFVVDSKAFADAKLE